MPSPEQRLNNLLADQSAISVATAESCTGGHVAGRLTNIAGSSAYFYGGVVSYANSAKVSLLGVPDDILENPGAVSEECARAMAEGAQRKLAATIGVSTTGIAGPDGGTNRKPVGLVYIGIATPDGIDVERHVFEGNRAAVMDAATTRALELLIDCVEQALGVG